MQIIQAAMQANRDTGNTSFDGIPGLRVSARVNQASVVGISP